MRLTIPLPPAHFQRPRPNNRGGYYSPHGADLIDWRALITNQMRVHGDAIVEGPVSVSFHIGADSTDIELTPIVGSEPARPKGIRFDLDNGVKFLADALEGHAYFNDKQIVDLSARFK